MNSFENILTIVQPRTESFVGIKKAILLAKRNHAELTILLVKPKLSPYLSWLNQKPVATKSVDSQVKNLRDFSAQVGIKTRLDIVEEQHMSHALAQHVNGNGVDLVVVEHLHKYTRLWPFDEDEYHQLLNASTNATMFVGRRSWQERGHVLTAIETEEQTPTHRHFNHEIVEKANHFAQLLLSDVHFVSCFSKSCKISFTECEEQQPEDKHFQHLTSLIAPYQFSPDHIHIKEGLVDDVLPNQARQLGVNLVILGCHEHKGLLANIKGHAIDYVLDQLQCDVLAVKPVAIH